MVLTAAALLLIVLGFLDLALAVVARGHLDGAAFLLGGVSCIAGGVLGLAGVGATASSALAIGGGVATCLGPWLHGRRVGERHLAHHVVRGILVVGVIGWFAIAVGQ